MLEVIADPSLWAGLVTLIVLELVLGIDNLMFIAILVEKLPEALRDRARVIGRLLALLYRLVLLASLSWLVTLIHADGPSVQRARSKGGAKFWPVVRANRDAGRHFLAGRVHHRSPQSVW